MDQLLILLALGGMWGISSENWDLPNMLKPHGVLVIFTMDFQLCIRVRNVTVKAYWYNTRCYGMYVLAGRWQLAVRRY